MRSYEGILLIGDPHAASKVIGFRKDDYPETVLRKLEWCLDYADANNLLAVCLGDLFHHPRDNANWLLTKLIGILGRHELYGIYGNHDCREGQLTNDDSLSVLVSAGVYRMLTKDAPWTGLVAGRQTRIVGISWNQPLTGVDRDAKDEFVVLATHHDMGLAGYEMGRIQPAELEGVDVVVNGHIHRRLQEMRIGKTRWLNPGNIARVSRSDAFRAFVPSTIVLKPQENGFHAEWIEIPHQSFDEVFHEGVEEEEATGNESVFVRGLAELQARRTQTGAGLREFLDGNLEQFEEEIRQEIESLAAEALGA